MFGLDPPDAIGRHPGPLHVLDVLAQPPYDPFQRIGVQRGLGRAVEGAHLLLGGERIHPYRGDVVAADHRLPRVALLQRLEAGARELHAEEGGGSRVLLEPPDEGLGAPPARGGTYFQHGLDPAVPGQFHDQVVQLVILDLRGDDTVQLGILRGNALPLAEGGDQPLEFASLILKAEALPRELHAPPPDAGVEVQGGEGRHYGRGQHFRGVRGVDTVSGIPPASFTIGTQPHACASTVTRPKLSIREGRQSTLWLA